MRRCFMLDLRGDPGLIREYEQWHTKIPAAVEAHLRRHGVLAMQIHRLGTRLCMLIDTDEHVYDPQAMANSESTDPELTQWEALMWRFQTPTPWTPTGHKWTEAPCLYTWDSG